MDVLYLLQIYIYNLHSAQFIVPLISVFMYPFLGSLVLWIIYPGLASL